MNTIAIKNDYYSVKEFSAFQKFTKLERFFAGTIKSAKAYATALPYLL